MYLPAITGWFARNRTRLCRGPYWYPTDAAGYPARADWDSSARGPFGGQLPRRDALAQGRLKFSEAPPSGRLVIMGQLRESTSLGSPETVFSDLTSRLDADGDLAFGEIPGEFCAAYLTPDANSAFLYRSVTALWPLYYRVIPEALVWSTDPAYTYPAAELRSAVVSDALPSLLFQNRYSSYLENVEVLEPGHCLELTVGGLQTVALDRIRLYKLEDLSAEEAARGVSERVSESVESLITPSCHISVALSGGIDSAVVLSEAARVTGGVSAFHCTLPSAAARPDLQSARQVAEMNGVPLVEVDLRDAVRHGGRYGECGHSCRSFHPHLGAERELLLAAADLAGRTVLMLSGILSDDLFGGVPPDRLSFNPLSLDSFWRGVSQLLTARSGSGSRITRSVAAGLLRPTSGILPLILPYLQSFGGPLIKADARETAVLHCLDSAKSVEVAYFTAAGRRRQSDRMRATALSTVLLQMRSIIQGGIVLEREFPTSVSWLAPFADRRLVEYCLSLPHEWRSGIFMGDRIDKVIWRYAFSDRAPELAVRQQLGNVFNNAANAFIENNVDKVAEVLNPDSALHAADVLDGDQAAGALRNPLYRAKYGFALLYAYRLEKWIEGLGQ